MIFDLREPSTDSTNKTIKNYCYFEKFNEIQIMFIMFQISFKFKFATVKALNSVHIKKKDYEHIDKYHDILVCQDLHAKSYHDIFDEVDIFKILKN